MQCHHIVVRVPAVMLFVAVRHPVMVADRLTTFVWMNSCEYSRPDRQLDFHNFRELFFVWFRLLATATDYLPPYGKHVFFSRGWSILSCLKWDHAETPTSCDKAKNKPERNRFNQTLWSHLAFQRRENVNANEGMYPKGYECKNRYFLSIHPSLYRRLASVDAFGSTRVIFHSYAAYPM